MLLRNTLIPKPANNTTIYCNAQLIQ